MVRESIRQAIEGKGMSQSRFARQLGMEASNFNAWLNGQRPLPYGTFIRTMNMLGLSVGPASVGFAYLPCEELPEIFLQQMRQTGIKVCNIVQATGIAQSVVSSFLTGVENPGSVDPVSQDNFDPWKLFNSDPRKFWPTGSFLFWIIWLCRI